MQGPVGNTEQEHPSGTGKQPRALASLLVFLTAWILCVFGFVLCLSVNFYVGIDQTQLW